MCSWIKSSYSLVSTEVIVVDKVNNKLVVCQYIVLCMSADLTLNIFLWAPYTYQRALMLVFLKHDTSV